MYDLNGINFTLWFINATLFVPTNLKGRYWSYSVAEEMNLQGNLAVLSIELKYGSKASNFLGLLVKAKFERN